MQLDRRDYADAAVITVGESRIDAAVAIQFKDRLREAAADGPGRVVLDLGQVEFLDSSGLGAVVAAMKQLGAGRRLELAALTPTVAKVFRLTRMGKVSTIPAPAGAAVSGLSLAG